jgi:hypothetical protein
MKNILHRHGQFSMLTQLKGGVLNQHPAIGYSHPLNTEGTFDNGPVMCRAKRESHKAKLWYLAKER